MSAWVDVIIPFRATDFHGVESPARVRQMAIWEAFASTLEINVIFAIQSPGKKFNRGKLINCAFKETSTSPYLIINDVDLLPSEDLLLQYYLPRKGGEALATSAVHLARRGTRYSSDPNFSGGALAMPSDIFSRINGFSNEYWGWGGEDQDLSRRLRASRIKIEMPSQGCVIDLEPMSIPEKMSALRKTSEKNMIKNELLENSKYYHYSDENIFNISGIRNIFNNKDYKVIDTILYRNIKKIYFEL